MYLLKISFNEGVIITLSILCVALIVFVIAFAIWNNKLRGKLNDATSGDILYDVSRHNFVEGRPLLDLYHGFVKTGFLADTFFKVFTENAIRQINKNDDFRKVQYIIKECESLAHEAKNTDLIQSILKSCHEHISNRYEKEIIVISLKKDLEARKRMDMYHYAQDYMVDLYKKYNVQAKFKPIEEIIKQHLMRM